MAKPILVTGFEAFGEHEINVSESVAKSLDGMEVRGHKIRSLVLSVDFDGSNRVACMLKRRNLLRFFTLVWLLILNILELKSRLEIYWILESLIIQEDRLVIRK